MREMIMRLINCGVPRETAIEICRIVRRDRGFDYLSKYVSDVEDECRRCYV